MNSGLKAQYSIVVSLLFIMTIVRGSEGVSGNGIKQNHSFQQYAVLNTLPMSMCPPVKKAAENQHHADEQGDDPHAHHRQMMEKRYTRSEKKYDLPDIPLVAMDGERTTLLKEIESDRPVMLNFIFTTCTTICPVLSATFLGIQKQLGEDRDQVRMISISIDPEHDTPDRLLAYAARFDAGPQWQFLTGGLDEVVTAQKAFDAYRGSKMNHAPTTFLRVSSGAPWVRFDGIASASDIIKEYRQLATH